MVILLADDHGLYRDSIKLWLETFGDMGEDLRIETAVSRDEITDFLEKDILPDLLVLDLCMPGMDGVESIREFHTTWPTMPILVVSANKDPMVIKGCIESGAAGFLSKSEEGKAIKEAIRQILSGNTYIPRKALNTGTPSFSHKQTIILRLLGEGCSNREIAERTHLTEGTVKQYLRDIMLKLDVDNRAKVALRARQILGLST